MLQALIIAGLAMGICDADIGTAFQCEQFNINVTSNDVTEQFVTETIKLNNSIIFRRGLEHTVTCELNTELRPTPANPQAFRLMIICRSGTFTDEPLAAASTMCNPNDTHSLNLFLRDPSVIVSMPCDRKRQYIDRVP